MCPARHAPSPRIRALLLQVLIDSPKLRADWRTMQELDTNREAFLPDLRRNLSLLVLKTNRRSDAWRTQVPRLERLMQQFEKGAWTMESALSAFADGADADASKDSSETS